ncbi:hypothetical protein Tsubulata_020799, partial [Turnera subulata]
KMEDPLDRETLIREPLVIYLWSAASYFTPLLGAFLADSYVGRYRMIVFGSICSLLVIHSYKISIDTGGIRSSSLAFGADQLGNGRHGGGIFESFFSWYYVSTSVSVLVGVTFVVYIQENLGWKVGFGVPAVLMFISFVPFILCSPFYVKSKPKPGLLTGLAQVVVAHQTVKLSSYHSSDEGAAHVMPSPKLRNPEEDLTPDGRAIDPWSLCTVEQVEELKALIKVIPIWSTGMIMSLSMCQTSLPVLQLVTMNRHITSNFEIPAGSFGSFFIISMTIWVALYNRHQKINGKPTRLSIKQRMGAGILLSSASTAAFAIVESVRRAKAIEEGFSDDPKGVVNMSAMWLLPHLMLGGVAQALNVIGQFEFYYSEFPKSMSSIAANLYTLGMSVANMVASLMLSVVDDLSGREGESWVSSNINKGHYDYFYWILSSFILANFMYYLACSMAYGPFRNYEAAGTDHAMEESEEKRMDNSIAVEEKAPLVSDKKEPRKGGLVTMPFIIVNETFERVASYGLSGNMIFYLKNEYHMETAAGSTLLFLWSALSNALALFGAFLSDSFLGRFRGTFILWLTAMIPDLKPPPCDQFFQACSSATAGQLAILVSSFCLISIGAGCVRPCSMAFGADQLDNKEKPNNEGVLQTFFNWYYAATALSTVFAFTVVVYIQDNLGWKVGFAVPAVVMLFAALMFLVGSSFYVKVKASSSLFTGFFQVVVASFRKRDLDLSPGNTAQWFHENDQDIIVPTNNLRFLNKACMIRDPQEDLNPDGSASNPWNLCTIEQVESLKAILRVIPIWSTSFMMTITMKQTSFTTLQASIMDRHITSDFEIPAGSFNVFTIVTVILWIAFYDRILVPLLTRHTGRRNGLRPKVRIGVGLLFSCLSCAAAAVVETIRRRIAVEEGLEDQPDAVMSMSAFWLIMSPILIGFADAFNAIGQIEFYYSQLPKSISSFAMALMTLGMAVGDLLSSGLVKVVDDVTSRNGKESWLSNNLNKGHLDYYYWLITGLSIINLVYFLVCYWVHGPSKDKKTEE